MLDWIMENKKWFFSGVGIAIPSVLIGWLWFQESGPPPGPTDNSVHQMHSGKNIRKHLHGSVDDQRLLKEIREAESVLAGIAPDRTDLRLKQSAEIRELKQLLETSKPDVFRLYDLFTRIPLNTERLRRAKEHFDKGEFREADTVLKAEEIAAEVEQLKAAERAAEDKLATVRQDLEDRANEFLIKARLSLLSPVPEGESSFERAQGWFEQALATARTAELLVEYADFLQKHNAFGQAEPLYQEALKIRRGLADANPEAFLPDVAMTLNNLALLHQATNAYGPALAEYEEALKHYRSLGESNPEVFLPNVAGTLNNLGELHRVTNNYGPALEEYEEALKIFRGLGESNPEAFLPDVATTLNNLANLHSATQAYGPALAEYEEALKIRRGLAESNPEAFLPDMAATLNNLAVLHADTQAFAPALKEYEEALKIRRGLAESSPEAFLPYVAETLNNLAGLHAKTKKYRTAGKEVEEALKIYRGLADANPEAFLPDLTMTLVNMSIFYLHAVPDKAKSVAYAQEARDILIPLCQQVPHLQNYLDTAEQVLAANNTKPEA